MGKRERAARQDDVLRLLDTRLACLMVDSRDAARLRPRLFQLREKLAREPLDRKTLAQVEHNLHELLPLGTARASASLADSDARSQARLKLVRR